MMVDNPDPDEGFGVIVGSAGVCIQVGDLLTVY